MTKAIPTGFLSISSRLRNGKPSDVILPEIVGPVERYTGIYLLQKHVEKVGAQRMPVRAARHGLLQNSIDELRIRKQSLHPQSGFSALLSPTSYSKTAERLPDIAHPFPEVAKAIAGERGRAKYQEIALQWLRRWITAEQCGST
jgi:hypothetical protein